MKTVKLPKTGKLKAGFGLRFDIVGYSRGNVILEVTDTDKYYYEKGHKYEVRRKLTKNKTFRFDSKVFDCSEVAGFDVL